MDNNVRVDTYIFHISRHKYNINTTATYQVYHKEQIHNPPETEHEGKNSSAKFHCQHIKLPTHI